MPQADDCKSSSILPREELNPLVNPLLGQHLGRWAEVYFTAAPDKREAAVQELLLQLQAEDPDTGDPSADRAGDETCERETAPEEMAPPEKHLQEKREPAPGSLADLAGKIVLAENTETEDSAPSDAIGAQADASAPDARLDSLPVSLPVSLYDSRPEPRPEPLYLSGLVDTPAVQPGSWPAIEPSQPGLADPTLLRSLLADPLAAERSRAPRRLPGLALMATLAIVALALGYFISGKRQASLPAATPVAAGETQNAAPPRVVMKPARPSNPDRDALPQTSSTMHSTVQKISNASLSARSRTDFATPPEARKGPDTASTVVSSASLQGAIPESANGSQELTLARSYLSGSDGKPPDSAEAAKWLWKAVAKQNVEASDLLSTLYLSGNGVPKNCDQARLLLDAAARKGRSQAAGRLTHLQAFGCE